MTGVDKIELIALLLAIAFVLIAEMINTAIEGAIDVATTSFDPIAKLAKDIAAGAVLIATRQRGRGRLPRLLRPVARPQPRACSTAARRAGRADAHRARADGHRRDRGQGVHRPRHAAAGRAAVRPRGDRVRRLDGGDVRCSATRALLPRLDRWRSSWRCSSRRPGSSRASTRSLEVASAGCSAPSSPRLFQVFCMTRRRAPRAGRRRRRARLRAVLGVPRRARPCGRATAACSRASTSRTRRTRSGSARSGPRSPRAVAAAAGPGDLEAIAITASPCGGCRQWLARVRPRPRHLPARRRRGRDAHARPSCFPTSFDL